MNQELATISKDLGLSTADNFNSLLNKKPRKAWLKVHKGVQYQPVENVKNTLNIIFQGYDWKVDEFKVIANTICVSGTMTVENPITGKKRSVSGVGGWPIQLKAGSKPGDFENIIQDAIQKNLPAAESLALKNAASKLGKIFGDGKNETEFVPMYSPDKPEVSEETKSKILHRISK